jgi:hypothetical protein
MKKHCFIFLAMMLVPWCVVGCRAEVKPTKDSTKIEVEVPKVEVKKTPDLDPRTDDDVDVKTPSTSN